MFWEEISWDPKKFQIQIFLSKNKTKLDTIFWQKFWAKNFSDQKLFWTHNFWTQNLFEHIIFLHKIFWGKNNFGFKILFDPKCFMTPILIHWFFKFQKKILEQILFDIFFRTKNFIKSKNLKTKFLLDPKSFLKDPTVLDPKLYGLKLFSPWLF